MRFEPSVLSPTTYGDAASMLAEAKRLPVLRQGATDAQTGNAVSRAINALIRNGIAVAGLTAPITPGRASYGAKVAAAVKSFQQDYDLSPADGIIGPKTWEVLLTLEATSGAKVQSGASVDAGTDLSVTPAAVEPPAQITLPDGTTVSRVPQSVWAKFRESRWFWPAVGGTALGGVILVGWLIHSSRAKKSA